MGLEKSIELAWVKVHC